MACFAGFLTGREAARAMAPRKRGTIIFTGASASLRGRSGFSAFSGAKHALRALAQSMAKELGPEGVHVAHVVIDGAIDTPWIRENFPDRAALKPQDGILEPDAIAEMYWVIHKQPRSAWTHEVDLRPWMEKRLGDVRQAPVKVEHHFDFGSPNCYFAHRAIPAIEQRTRATFVYVRRCLLGGIFKATNNRGFADRVQRHREQAGLRPD